ncbi:MAG: hypothetical protein R3B99_01210 [Polyangiales bacterium]
MSKMREGSLPPTSDVTLQRADAEREQRDLRDATVDEVPLAAASPPTRDREDRAEDQGAAERERGCGVA